MYLSTHINEYVIVRLTSHGKDHLESYFQRLWDSVKLAPDDECRTIRGLHGHEYRVQLWELMHIFGSELWNGNPRSMFVDSVIKVDVGCD